MTTHISVMATNLLPSMLAHKVFDMRLANAASEVAKVVDVPEVYINDVLRELDHTDERIEIMVRHPFLPELSADFVVLGVGRDCLYGYVDSDDRMVNEVLRHIEQFNIVDEPEIASMHITSDYYNSAVLRINAGVVELVITATDSTEQDEASIEELADFIPAHR